jgi:PKD repeat protein
LTATITGGSNVTYTWGFGDGAYGRGEVVLHTYPDVGDYTAIVTASNSINEVTATTTIRIFGSYRYLYLPVLLKDR